MENNNLIDRRKHRRSEFAYPVDIKFFSPHPDNTSFSSYMKDISVSGACIEFEDRYGRVNLEELPGFRVKITISMPSGGKISVLSRIKWIRKDTTRHFFIVMGVEFENMEDWQLEDIKKFISLKNKDHNMMWNLWEQYEKQL